MFLMPFYRGVRPKVLTYIAEVSHAAGPRVVVWTHMVPNVYWKSTAFQMAPLVRMLVMLFTKTCLKSLDPIIPKERHDSKLKTFSRLHFSTIATELK